nr:hypothetical protein [uncultured Acetatifactor sp.]
MDIGRKIWLDRWIGSAIMLCASISSGWSNQAAWPILTPEAIIFPKRYGC